MLGSQCLELADDIAVTAEIEVSIDPLPVSDEAKFLEPADLRLSEIVECELRERRPTPQRKRRLQKRTPLLRRKPPRVGERLLEPTRVDLFGTDVEHVARRAGVEDVTPKSPTQTSDGVLERRRRRFWRLLTPERVDEPVG